MSLPSQGDEKELGRCTDLIAVSISAVVAERKFHSPARGLMNDKQNRGIRWRHMVRMTAQKKAAIGWL
jgi:hypothetical protein